MLLIIFLIALIIRFLFFPNNIYFGFDQARDAFQALSLAHGDLKLIGPSTSFEGLFHGVAYYYLIAPVYGLTKGSPEIVAFFLRLLNASGVFIIFYLGKIMFSKKVGLISALLFATSFEENQFAIYMGNPAPAVLSVMLMYLGLALVIFQKKPWGLPLAFLGLGFSIQFEFGLFYLVVPFLILLVYFRKSFLKLNTKYYFWSIVALTVSLISFLLAELKYGFKTLNALIALASSGSSKDILVIFKTALFTISRILAFNLIGDLSVSGLVGILLLICLVVFIWKSQWRSQSIFLSVWFFSLVVMLFISGGVKDLNTTTPLFYPNVGVSISLLIFLGLLFSKIGKIGWLILAAVTFINIQQVFLLNPKGTMSEIDVQQGMLLSDEKKVLDNLYKDAEYQPFAVEAITMPFFVNTTWSYLFEWYGKDKYNYLPIWNGKNAPGYLGNLEVVEVQEKLPVKRFLIIEPTRGVAPYLIDDYLKNENYFTKVKNERKIGEFVIQSREIY